MLSSIPRPLLVGLIFFAAIVVFLVAQPPHRACQSKIDGFMQAQKGRLFAGAGKNIARRPKVLMQVENCKMGNSPGACYELFHSLRSVTHDLAELPLECNEDIAEVPEIKSALYEGLGILVQIAWGESPPSQNVVTAVQPGGWLEASDLALFCRLKDLVSRVYGQEGLEQVRASLFGKLPGEEAKFVDGKCENCEYRKKASEVLSAEEFWSKSLFSTRCNIYR